MRLLVVVAVASLIAIPAPARAQTQPSSVTPSQATPPTGLDASQSLFTETWRQVEIGGRISSIAGDPARFQRYEDLRDGVLLTNTRYAGEGGGGLFAVEAYNVGWRDQRYRGTYERPGRFAVSGLWDEIPQFYSVDTRTPYTLQSTAVLVLDDDVQRAIQNGQANLNAWVPIAPQFDLRERRDIGRVDFTAFATPALDVRGSFTTTKHSGELPWGATFGFSNDVEVALPYDSRTNDLSVGAEWKNNRAMLRVAYDGSWFDNQSDPLVWDNPLRLDDSTSAPGRGRMSLWPSNSANTVSGAGYAKLAGRTQVNGAISVGVWSNDQPLQPFTINSALPQLALPRATADASATVVSMNVNAVSRPADDWRLSARLRSYDFSNDTPVGGLPQFVSYDTSVSTSLTGGPEPYSHNRLDFNADATWTGLAPFALTAGYVRNHTGYDFRIFQDSAENGLYLSADAVGTQWVTLRARYDFADRNGSGLDEEALIHIGEQPGMRHYDLADRTRHRFTGLVDVTPNEWLTASLSAGLGKDDYDDTEFGLQEATFRTFSVGVDAARADGWGAGASYTYERYFGAQQSRSANPGEQAADPLRNWTVDSTERVDYFLVYLRPPRVGRAEARVSYDYGHARGTFLYAVVPGGPLPPPSQLPEVFNKLQELRIALRYGISNRLVASINYLYEPFRVFDFAFDRSVVDGIVQPSSLVLGYVYRPYTAHSVVAGVRYFF